MADGGIRWAPRVTVAALVAREGRYLFVEEALGDGHRLNQPAGHLEPGEGLIDAVIRETREETGWLVEPTGLVGLYRWAPGPRRPTYLRVAFAARPLRHDPQQPLDPPVVRALWLDRDGLQRFATPPRSPLVMRCLDDFLAGAVGDLGLIRDLAAGG